MPARPKLDRLARNIKAELIEQILISGGERYDEITRWLLETHGVETSKTSVWKFAQAILLRHGGLVALGVPIKTIADRSDELDELGAYLVQKMLIDKIIDEKFAAIFSALTETQAEP